MLGYGILHLRSVRVSRLSVIHFSAILFAIVGCSQLVRPSGVLWCSRSISSSSSGDLVRWTRLVSCLGSVSFDDSRLDHVRRFSTRSRLGLVRWLSITFVDSRLARTWRKGYLVMSRTWMGVSTVCLWAFYTRTFLEVLFASYSIYTLESHGINNNLLTHWKPLSSCHSILFILHQITILETRLSFTKWGLLRLSIPLP